jgi:hypothetical protein
MALWSSWTWGQKKPYGGFSFTKFLIRKTMISCDAIIQKQFPCKSNCARQNGTS